MGRAERFAGELLSWGWSGAVLVAEISAARYVIRGERHEVLAHAELRDVGGRRRIEIGSFATVSAARAACELHAAALCRREDERPAIDVRIARGRTRC